MLAEATSPAEVAAFRERCRKDPFYFARVVWGRRRWSGQRRLRLAMAEHQLVVVYSANGVGKTSELAAWAIEDAVLNPGTRITLVGPKFDNVKDGLFAEIRDLYFNAKIPLGGDMQTSRWLLGSRWDIACAGADTPSSFQGRRGKLRTKVVIDEAQGDIGPEYWDALLSLMTQEGSQFIASGNPITSGGRFREIATNHALGWHVISLSALDHPNIRQRREVLPGPSWEDLERKRKQWGENDPRWIARVLGRFPPASADQLVSEDWFAAGCERLERPGRQVIPELKGRRIGVDVARQGDDSCVLVVLEDGVVIHVETWEHARLTETAARTQAAATRFGVEGHNVHLDVTGIGAGAADDLQRVGMAVDEVNFGAGPVGDWPELTSGMEVKNRRGELHWIAARLIERGEVVVPAEFAAIRSEAVQPRYRWPNGCFVVEEKESIKKRIGRSPDYFDALITALSNGGGIGVSVLTFGGGPRR